MLPHLAPPFAVQEEMGILGVCTASPATWSPGHAAGTRHIAAPTRPPLSAPARFHQANHFKAVIETDQMREWCLPPRVVSPTGK